MEFFFRGWVFQGFRWVMELMVLVFVVVVLDLLVPHAPCESRSFMAIQAGFSVAIILADGVDTATERLYAWMAGYFLAYAVVGTRWFQGG